MYGKYSIGFGGFYDSYIFNEYVIIIFGEIYFIIFIIIGFGI